MQATPQSLAELTALLSSDDPTVVMGCLDALAESKGRKSTTILTNYLRVAPAGPLAARASMALEIRGHKSCLPVLHDIYKDRPDLSDDIIPIFSALEDYDAIALVVDDLHILLSSSSRLATLAFLIKCADHEALVDVLLPLTFQAPIPGADDDLRWAVETILSDANDALLAYVKEMAATLGPDAMQMVEPFLPPESELEKAAPTIARAFVGHLQKQDLIELIPEFEDALVDVLVNAICEARSPKGLVRDVERVLMDSTAIEEVYASREDIRQAFTAVTS
jgi:chemotaxis regulatin CheY-phosphate phosphatase CheZ